MLKALDITDNMKNKETISFKDFEEQFMQAKETWDFSMFKIVCVKCGSLNVEYEGESEADGGWYGDVDFEHKIIIKCHDCGNAHTMKSEASGNGGCNCDCD